MENKFSKEKDLSLEKSKFDSSKEGFDKDFNELKRIVNKNNKLCQEYLESQEECIKSSKNLINNYLKNDKIGSSHNYNYKINHINLLEYLNCTFLQGEKDEYIRDFFSEGFYLYYTLEKIYKEIENLDPIENINTPNNLDINNSYFISKELEYYLNNGFNLVRSSLKKEYFYVVIFNFIKNKNGEETLIYNYVEYNSIFKKCFYIYTLLEQMSLLIHYNNNIGSKNYFIIEDKLIKDESNYNINIEEEFFSRELRRKNSEKYDFPINIIDLLKILTKGKLFSYNYKDLSYFLHLMYNRDISGLLNLIPSNDLAENLKDTTKEYFGKSILLNPLSRLIFVVSDLEKFLLEVRNSGFKNLNQGPQKHRGSGSYINYTLTNLDRDFRIAMYKHNTHFHLNGRANYIHKNKFSYKNIHINLGNKRWYSTLINKDKSLLEINSSRYTIKNIENRNLMSTINNKEIVEVKKMKFDDFNKNSIFVKLAYILNNEPLNEDTQIKIEKLLFSQRNFFGNKKEVNIFGVDTSKYTKDFNIYCLDKENKLIIYLKRLLENLNSNKRIDKDVNLLIRNKDINNYYMRAILNEVDHNEIINFLFYTFFTIITYNDVIDTSKDNKEENFFDKKLSLLNNNLKFGKHICNSYIRNKYYKYKEVNKDLNRDSFSEYKKDFLSLDKNNVLNSDEFHLSVGSTFIEILLTIGMIEIKVLKVGLDKNKAIYTISEKIKTLLNYNNEILILPFNLPMIVKPKYFSKDKLGGYLLNDVEYQQNLFSDTKGHGNKPTIKDSSIIFSVINKIMSTPFKINKPLLDYLITYNYKHNLLIEDNFEHKYANLEKRNKSQDKEYKGFISKKILENHILDIAQIYSNVPELYFPIKLDYRGRLYAIPAFLNYQGSELAKSLFLFAKPDVIKRNEKNCFEYLKAYGATCFGNGLNRKSYDKRLAWVNENWDNIINFELSDLVQKADNKFLFLAFCFELRRYNNFIMNENIHEFKTYLPIQLDGTCNGFQHLALLSNETKLFESLNLSESSKNKDPKDFYQNIINHLYIYIENILAVSKDTEKKEAFRRLLKSGVTRSNIKTAIMTKPYNAKTLTSANYIKDSFEVLPVTDKDLHLKKIKQVIKPVYKYKYAVNKDNKNYVYFEDILLLVSCINEIIHFNYPRIKFLSEYLKDIVVILNKLNLPVMWNLPSGLEISQQYKVKHSKQIRPFQFLSTAISLSFTDNLKVDKRKQTRSFMPNLVHSLDSSTLMLLYYFFNKSLDNKNVNFYSVHDCYGVTAKHVDNLISLLRVIYIDLYSDEGYIKKFDRDIITYIMNTYNKDKCQFDEEKRILHVNRKKIKFPQLNSILENTENKNIYGQVSKALYLIK